MYNLWPEKKKTKHMQTALMTIMLGNGKAILEWKSSVEIQK